MCCKMGENGEKGCRNWRKVEEQGLPMENLIGRGKVTRVDRDYNVLQRVAQ